MREFLWTEQKWECWLE